MVALDLPATVVFTSGSTGEPKAALHTFGNHYFSAADPNANIRLRPGDRWLHSLPLYHVGGLSILFRCLLAGATVVLPDPDVPLGETISRSEATHVSLVSTQLLRLLRGDATFGSLKAVLLGGGPMQGSLLDEATGRGLPVHTSYGLTEMAAQMHDHAPGRFARGASHHRSPVATPGGCGISDEGEILVRGETLFAGYVEGDELERPLDQGGWFHTGDLGELDGGYLRVLGRMDNLFVSGGENVRPEEIEDALSRDPGRRRSRSGPCPRRRVWRPASRVRAVGEGRAPHRGTSPAR